MTERMTLSTTQVAKRLGIENGAVRKLATQGYLTDIATNGEGNKRHFGAFYPKDVRFLERFYEKKGKDWKKAYAAAKANPDMPIPTKPKPTKALIRAALDKAEAAKPTASVAGVLTRLGNIETKLELLRGQIFDMFDAVARLEGMWK